ncbi:MAG: NAD(P)-dependent oxidoreductase [Hyphomonadaceae bacterium]|nr:NAD(P)-dependent oxidoreductase [Hyphomonadaceae bacterium]
MTRIAFLGLGAMGSRIAARLLSEGFDLTVWNRDPAKAVLLGDAGAHVAGSARAAATGADVVISMVTDDEAARSVWLDPTSGALAAMKPGSVALEMSTVTPDWVRELAKEADRTGVMALDAPVAGSRPQAEAGQLVLMVGGDAAVLDQVRPVLEPMAANVLPAGPAGRGAELKLAVNTYFAAQLASLAELLGFLTRSGFEAGEAAELLAAFPVVAPPLAGAARMMAAGNSAPMFTIDLIEKDLGYVLAAGEAAGASLPGAAHARAVFQQAQAQGLGAANITGLARVFAV